MVEVEGAFFIGLVSATVYLAFSRFLELVHIEDMVRAQRERRQRTARKHKQGNLVWMSAYGTPVLRTVILSFCIFFGLAGENNLSLYIVKAEIGDTVVLPVVMC